MEELNISALSALFAECTSISRKKSKDYGIQGLKEFGTAGITVRLNDKMERLKTLVFSSDSIDIKTRAYVKDESIEDTAMDMVNYAAYIVLKLRGTLSVETKENKFRKIFELR